MKVEKTKTKKSKEKNESVESNPQKKSDKEKSLKKKTKESNKIKLHQQLDDLMNKESDDENIDDQSNIVTTFIEPEFVSLKNKKKNKRKRVYCLMNIVFLEIEFFFNSIFIEI